MGNRGVKLMEMRGLNLCGKEREARWFRIVPIVGPCVAPTVMCLRVTSNVCKLPYTHIHLLNKKVEGDSFGNRPKKMRIAQRLFIRF